MLQAGIVGLPNVGKSTLFNALTAQEAALAANYPFATIEPNVGVVAVPDERLPILEKMYKTQKTVPATVEFVDIAGLVRGASKGEGLGNQFLANIRETEAILHVVRAFEDPNVVHVEHTVDPGRDIEIIETELLLADLETLNKRIERIGKMARVGNKEAQQELEEFTKAQKAVDAGTPLRAIGFTSDLNLLTSKPVLYVANVAESNLGKETDHVKKVREVAEAKGGE